MAKRFVIMSIALCCFFLSNSCSDTFLNECFSNQDTAQSETRELDNFSKIEINDLVNIEFVQDSLNVVELSTNGDNIAAIKTQVLPDSTLVISNENRCRMFSGYDFPVAKVHYKQLDSILVKGQNRIISADTMRFDVMSLRVFSELADVNLILKGRRFYFRTEVVATSGTMIFSGNVYYAYYAVGGYLHTHAQSLNTTVSYVDTETTGIIHVKARDKLSCTFRSVGDIYSYGVPQSIEIVADAGYGGKLIMVNDK